MIGARDFQGPLRHGWKALALVMLLTTGVLLLFARGSWAAGGLSINDLVERAEELDGQEVTVTGEAIGDVMVRGQNGWVNIYDGTLAVGIWAPAKLLEQVKHAGRYQMKGDWVRVTGTFYRMDTQHGGDLDIHAHTLTVVEPGGPVIHRVDPTRVIWAVVFRGTAALTGTACWRRFWYQPRRR